jgi:hypothetical protein
LSFVDKYNFGVCSYCATGGAFKHIGEVVIAVRRFPISVCPNERIELGSSTRPVRDVINF